MTGFCSKCGKLLNQYNPGPLCNACQLKKLDKFAEPGQDCYNAQELADILGLKSEEAVKRLGRKGKLPPRVPVVKQWLWAKDVIKEWIRGGHQAVEPGQDHREVVIEWPGPRRIVMYEKVDVQVFDAEGKITTETRILPSTTNFGFFVPPPQA